MKKHDTSILKKEAGDKEREEIGAKRGLSEYPSTIVNHKSLAQTRSNKETQQGETGKGRPSEACTDFDHVAPPDPVPVSGRGGRASIRRVLLMDDEKLIRDFAVQVLNRFGYDAEISKDGAEAIELYKKARESGEPFDAVILDLTNQFGMGGKEAIRKLLEIDPDVKGIVSTGYSNDPVVTRFRDYGFCGVLTKPYTINELSRALHDVISEEKEQL